MISSETPYKLAEIYRDIFPNLYNPPKDFQTPSEYCVRLNTKLYNKGAALLHGCNDCM